jgi:hypothetical protein
MATQGIFLRALLPTANVLTQPYPRGQGRIVDKTTLKTMSYDAVTG